MAIPPNQRLYHRCRRWLAVYNQSCHLDQPSPRLPNTPWVRYWPRIPELQYDKSHSAVATALTINSDVLAGRIRVRARSFGTSDGSRCFLPKNGRCHWSHVGLLVRHDSTLTDHPQCCRIGILEQTLFWDSTRPSWPLNGGC